MKSVNLTAIAIAAALTIGSGCASEQDERFDPRGIGNRERLNARKYAEETLRPLPTTLQSQFLPENRDKANAPKEPPIREPLAAEGRIVRLPLREAIQRAVLNNHNVKVSGYAPAIEETRVTEAESRFDPEFFTEATFRANRQPGTQFTGDNSDTLSGAIGLRQLLPSGGQIEASYRPQRVNFDPQQFSTAPDPAYVQQFQIELTQPLLRDFGTDINRARIVINRNNQRVSLLDFRKDLEEMLRNVEETYWRLVQAQRNVDIQERLLDRTITTSKLLQDRFGQDVTMEQISNAISRNEATRADLIRARQRVRDLSDQLKNLMNDPDYPVAGGTLILPASDPMLEPIVFDKTDAVSTALLNRFDLAQQQIRVDSATVALQVAKNNRLPQLNFVGSIGVAGLGEDYLDAFSPVASGDQISWSVGLQFTQKIGNREALSIMRRAQLQRLQAIEQYRGLVDQAAFEVSVAMSEVDASWQSIAQTRAARFAAAKALDIVDTLQNQGEPLNPNFIDRKLNRQQELAQAERAEADAIALYNIAISRLESAKGTLLRFNNVLMEEAPRVK